MKIVGVTQFAVTALVFIAAITSACIPTDSIGTPISDSEDSEPTSTATIAPISTPSADSQIQPEPTAAAAHGPGPTPSATQSLTASDNTAASGQAGGTATVTLSIESGPQTVFLESITILDADDRPAAEIDPFDALNQGWLTGGWAEQGQQVTFGAAGDVEISVPTEGPASSLILDMRSSSRTVWVGAASGAPASNPVRLYVTPVSHRHYVPLVKNLEIVLDTSQVPQWYPDLYFPEFPESQTGRLFVLRVTTPLENQQISWQTDWRTSDSFDTQQALTLAGMQGLLNRHGPSLYLDWDEYGTDGLPVDPTSSVWIDLIEEHLEVIELGAFEGTSATRFIDDRFGYLWNGAVVYDPEIPDTINLATMLAGVHDLLVLSPQQASLPQFRRLDVQFNLVDIAAQLGWNNSPEERWLPYAWALENYWDPPGGRLLEDRIMGVISPGPPIATVPVEGGSAPLPVGVAARDYLISLGLSALWLDPTDLVAPNETDLFRRFMSSAPSPIPVTGVHGGNESIAVSFGADYGNWEAAISRGNAPLSGGNLTVFSGIRAEPRSVRQDVSAASVFATLGSSPVMTIFSSDGDSVHYQMDRGYHGGVDFQWPTFLDKKYGWTINPTLSNLAPIIWNYYVDTRRQNSLVAGLAGAGFTHPGRMDDEELADYLDYAADYIATSGIRTVRVPHAGNDFDERMARAYFDALDSTGYLGIYFGTSSSPVGLPQAYPGLGVPTISPAYTLDAFNRDEILDDLAGREPGVIHLDPVRDGIALHGSLASDLAANESVALEIPGSFGADPACCLAIKTAPLNLTPGDYSVTFRMRLPDGPAGSLSVNIYAGEGFSDPTTVYTTLSTRSIAEQDFISGGNYQDFDFNFTALSTHRPIEIRLDFFGDPDPNAPSRSDLLLDEIRIENTAAGQLPILAPIFIGLVGPIDPLDNAMLLGQEFENSGGIVLLPHEFAAILNVNFMAEFLWDVLGNRSSAAIEAWALVNESRWLEALQTIRAALRELPESMLRAEISGQAIQIFGQVYFEELKSQAGGNRIDLRVHSAPGPDRLISILFDGLVNPDAYQAEVDGLTVELRSVSDRRATAIGFRVPAGSHRITLSN